MSIKGFDEKVLGIRYKVLSIILLVLLGILGFVVAETTLPSSVDLKVLTILYGDYDSVSPDFSSLNASELLNVSNAFFDNSQYGRIEFLEDLDIVAMHGGTYLVDFNSHMNISDNLIVVDELSLVGINKSVRLTIRDLTFSDPIIYNKGVVCSSCVLESYSGGVIVFTSPIFEGPYYIREGDVPEVCGNDVCESGEDENSCPADCEEEPSGGGGSGDGGGGDTSPVNTTGPSSNVYSLKVYPPLMELQLRKGVYFQKSVRLENNGSTPISVGIGVSELRDYIFPEERVVTLQPGELKDVRLDIYVPKDAPADVYLGKILFQSNKVQKNIDVILQVLEHEALFDIKVEVLKRYINPGGRVRANISLINMGDLRHFDVNLDYRMIDFDQEVYVDKSEQFAINVTHSGIYHIDVPNDASMGNYIFYSVVRYGDINATSYDTFVVENISTYAWLLLIGVIILMMIVVLIFYKRRKKEKEALKSNAPLKISSQKQDAVNKAKGKELKYKKVGEADVGKDDEEVPLLP